MRRRYVDDRKHNVLEVLQNALERLVAEADERGFAMFLIGTQRSRALSDVLGYSFSEEVVSLAGERMVSSLREQDSVVRLSSDEFAVLLRSDPSAGESGIVAKRMIDLLQRPYAIRGQVVNLNACIGIVQGPQYGVDAELLLNRAGIALRAAQAAYHRGHVL